MRKQYHFWPSENGLDAWDVDRLIALSRSLVPRTVALEDIAEVDSVYWFDEQEQPTVRKVIEHARLIREVDLSYPIILGVDGRVMETACTASPARSSTATRPLSRCSSMSTRSRTTETAARRNCRTNSRAADPRWGVDRIG